MSDKLTTLKDIKIPYPNEGIIRTASIDDTVTPQNSAQLAVNMNFDRVGAIQTRPGVTTYADTLVEGIKNYGTLTNFYPDGFYRAVPFGARTTFDTSAKFLSAAKIDDTHIIMFWCGPSNFGKAQVFEINTANGSLTPLSTALEFLSSDVFWNNCIKIDSNHFLNVYRGVDNDGFARVFTFDATTYAVTAAAAAYEFDTTDSTNMSLAQADANHFICFYTGNNDTDGIATILAVNLSTWAVTEPGSPLTFAFGVAAQNSCAALGDGTHFVNTWNGIARTFTVNTGTWNISTLSTVSVLVVGGGGGGNISSGVFYGGGGGAGELKYDATHAVAAGAYSVTVGAGGAAVNNGASSIFDTLTSVGGGKGGKASTGFAGGSGGGGSQNGNAGGASTASGGGFGNAGGAGANAESGGGGGAGAAGGAGTPGGPGGNGGIGKAYSISGSSTYYAGGGAGSTGATGGQGGGGNSLTAGTANTGGGGGGSDTGTGYAGGSGVVIVSYVTGTITATGGTITTSGGNTIHTFTTSGTFTVTALADQFIFDAAGSSFTTLLPLGDSQRFMLFWRSSSAGEGKVRVINVNLSTFYITGLSTALQFSTTAAQNAAVSLGDGQHFVNLWSTDADDGFTQVFNVNQSTYQVTATGYTNSIGHLSHIGVSAVSVFMSTYRFVSFWATETVDAIDTSSVFRVTGELLGGRLYAQSGDKIYNLTSGVWVSRRSGLSTTNKARFSQFLNYIWMVNGSLNIGGSPVATSSGGAFGSDLVPDDFPTGDFIQAGFEGRVWVFDRILGVIFYTDIVQFIPPSSYTLTYDPAVNFISTIAPQTGQRFTAVCQVPRALLVFTEDTIYRIYGASSIDAYPAYNVGTYSQESIVKTKTGIFFHHSSGFYQFDYGSQPVEISRRVIDFVKAIPRSYYDDIIGVYDGYDAVLWSVGPVTVEGVTFTSCVMRYTISTQTWTIYDYVGNVITAMIQFDDDTALNHLMGTQAGRTGAMDTGNTDYSSPFYYEYIDRWRSFSEIYAQIKSISGINVYSENAAGANIMYQIQKSGANVWQELGTVNDENNSLLPNVATDDFDVLRLRINGQTSGPSIVIHGIEIMQITIKGFNQN